MYERFQCSSASRKFLNTIHVLRKCGGIEFQCSSASRKFLNVGHPASISVTRATFQCSSASRKFLNLCICRRCRERVDGFSALQRAENSSIQALRFQRRHHPTRFSALQRAENSSIHQRAWGRALPLRVSVLFSEPKIPQLPVRAGEPAGFKQFQCSSASRKFLNASSASYRSYSAPVSVLFSEPKIPQ